MNEHLKQIAQRLRGLRDSLDLSVEEMAEHCAVPLEEYRNYENGDCDIPMNFLCSVADRFQIEPSALLAGAEPKMSSYYLTRKDKGISVERQKAYKYQALAMGFKKAKAKPFIVTVEPNDTSENELHLNSHEGQEFNMVLEGSLLLMVDGKKLVLNEGDSIYFDATKKHGMKALNNATVRFFAIII